MRRTRKRTGWRAVQDRVDVLRLARRRSWRRLSWASAGDMARFIRLYAQLDTAGRV